MTQAMVSLWDVDSLVYTINNKPKSKDWKELWKWKRSIADVISNVWIFVPALLDVWNMWRKAMYNLVVSFREHVRRAEFLVGLEDRELAIIMTENYLFFHSVIIFWNREVWNIEKDREASNVKNKIEKLILYAIDNECSDILELIWIDTLVQYFASWLSSIFYYNEFFSDEWILIVDKLNTFSFKNDDDEWFYDRDSFITERNKLASSTGNNGKIVEQFQKIFEIDSDLAWRIYEMIQWIADKSYNERLFNDWAREVTWDWNVSFHLVSFVDYICSQVFYLWSKTKRSLKNPFLIQWKLYEDVVLEADVEKKFTDEDNALL